VHRFWAEDYVLCADDRSSKIQWQVLIPLKRSITR